MKNAPWFKLFIQSLLAGMCIALGGTVFLRVKDAFPAGTAVGAMLFSVGLLVICTRGYALFTGKACALFDNKPSYLFNLALIWAGNFLGTGLVAMAERATVINGIAAAAESLVTAKLQSPPVSLFILGIFCNIFIFISVSGYAKAPHETGKYLSLILGVTCFILCGTEHCIADMYYFWVSGLMLTKPAACLACLAVITAGNLCGAVLFPLLERFK